MTELTTPHRFYGDLAPWWPLISAPEEYAEEAAFVASLLRTPSPDPASSGASHGPASSGASHDSASSGASHDSATGATAPDGTRTVLELGSGGGNNAYHLKHEFAMTLVDLSPDMIAVSQRLNPDCEHLTGDMRTVRLGRQFDAVFVHDAIEYMTTEADLRQAVETVFVHCRPGGVAVLVPDDIAENFEPGTDSGGTDAPDGRGVRYLSWSIDPDPADTTTITEYAFLLREADGSVQVAHDTHRLGLFPRATWLQVLRAAGFTARAVAEVTSEDRLPREFFVGVRQG